jgi:PAS domain S-box-containing protein
MVVVQETAIKNSAKGRRTEETPEWRAEDFRTIVTRNADAMIVLGQNGYVLYVNPAAESLFNLTSDEMVGSNFGFPIILDEPIELVILREFKEFVAAEMRMVEVVWRGKSAYLLSFRDLTDRIMATQSLNYARDELDALVKERTRELSMTNELLQEEIAERKRAEERLHESYRFTSAYLSNMPGIIYRRRNDMDWTMEFLSPGTTKITGYDIRDLFYNSKVSYGQLINPGDRERVWNEVQAAIVDKKPFKIVYRIITARGEEKWVLEQGHRRFRNGREVLEGYISDITETKKAEEALQESEERFRTLADNIPNLAFMTNPDGWIFWYNKQWYDYTGTTLEEMQGWGWQKVHHPDYIKAVTEKWSASIKAGRPYEDIFPLRGKDGKYRWFLTRVTPIRDAQGNIQRWFGTNTDITERKQAEEALIESKQQAELYVDLMSHDINNMNHSAMGYLELALETLDKEKSLKPDDKTLIERPMQSLVNSSALIGNVRKLQKLMTEGIKTKPTDLDEIFKEMEATGFHWDDRDVRINIQHVQGIVVDGNELLKDVFLNLITNAVKHSDKEKPLIINVKVEPVDENGHQYYRCMVEDNGPGIPDELKNRLFHRFQRGATRTYGKGLGLYIVRTLVEGCQGRVWVEDRVPGDYSQGARFVVLLPAASH